MLRMRSEILCAQTSWREKTFGNRTELEQIRNGGEQASKREQRQMSGGSSLVNPVLLFLRCCGTEHDCIVWTSHDLTPTAITIIGICTKKQRRHERKRCTHFEVKTRGNITHAVHDLKLKGVRPVRLCVTGRMLTFEGKVASKPN